MEGEIDHTLREEGMPETEREAERINGKCISAKCSLQNL